MKLLSRPEPDFAADNRRALLAERLREAAREPERVPLSFAQQRLWVIDQLEPHSSLYNVPVVVSMTGEIDVDALEKALNALVARHEILRTRFVCPEEDPIQLVDNNARIALVRRDLTHLPADQREAAARNETAAEAARPFDLTAGPLLRALLLRLDSAQHWFVLTLHHIISDEWSLQKCFRDLAAYYEGFLTGKVPDLPDLPIQYADYALWQREWIKNGVLEKQLAYWRSKLQGSPPVLALPSNRPRPALPAFRGGHASHRFSFELSERVAGFATRHNASSFMVLLAAFKALVHRYTGQTDVVVGSPIAGRTRMETEELIGFFVNTLVLRTDLAGNPSFETVLARVRDTTLGAYAHQDLPFEKLVEELRPERTLDHMPFTRVMFAIQNSAPDEIDWPGVRLKFLDFSGDTAKFDLTLVVKETRGGLIAHAEFNRELFNAEFIAGLLRHFEVLLAAAIETPETELSELPLVTMGEQRRLLNQWAADSHPISAGLTALFEAKVDLAPNAIAIAYPGGSITWRDLNNRANQLAHYLQTFGVGTDVPVALCLERSVDLIVAMLAVIKAGGAYVPLDAAYPKARLAAMLEDCGAPVIVTQQKLLNALPRSIARVICLDSDWHLVARKSTASPTPSSGPDHLAYIMYTSGSTGEPKGVAVPQRAVTRLVLNANYISITPEDRIAQTATISFDAATFEIWGALLNGATLVGIEKEVAVSPEDFIRELRAQQISVLFLTTALFNQVAGEDPAGFSTLRVLLFGGEAVDPKWVRAVLKHRPRHLLHVYGPTENTTFSTWHEIAEVPDEACTVPIGTPISGTQCFILDAHLKPVPPGVPGELYLGGDGLARGYWNQPELTAQKFIPHPFSSEAGTFLYRTGDLVRACQGGPIEFIGRLDQQVKIRGFRIEPGEIEATLSQHPDVRECAVSVCGTAADEKRLVAYVVPRSKHGPGASELRRFLKEKLPDYMVPAAFVKLASMPLTANGKVNRAALPVPQSTRPELEKRYATPEDAVEVELTRIWENVLGIRPIGTDDKFFELGGHSLLAVKVIAQIEKTFGRKLRLATIFQAQTIEQLAAILRKEIHEDAALVSTSIVEVQPRGLRPPLFFIHGAGGGMFWGYVNLSRHLGQDQPVYGIRCREADGDDGVATIEEMAAQYVRDIQALQPKGPYHIGGYCFGGNVAFEIARQLHARGEEVALLALFNCAPPNSRYSRILTSPKWIVRFVVNLGYWFRYFLNWTPPQRREFFRWKFNMLRRRLSRLFKSSPATNATVDAGELVDLSSYSPEQRRLWENHIRALIQYRPQPYAGRVHLFRSPGHPLLCSFDPDYGWGDLARGGVEIVTVPGVHEKILEEPCVGAVAQKLNAILEASRESEPPPVADSPSVNPEHRQLIEWNNTRVDFPLLRNYAAHFEAQAAKTPDAIALRFENAQLTYRALNERANQLAHHLQQLGVGPEVLVAVSLDRSLELPIALLAVLKAGGAYLPLDRSYPADRLNHMLTDSRARVLLTQADLAGGFPKTQAQVLVIDDPAQTAAIARRPVTNPACKATLDSLAYVIYTSGSTGTPKGVEIIQRGLLNHNLAVGRVFELTSSDRVLQFSPFSFDISIEEIFPTWIHGGALVVRTEELISSVARFMEFVSAEGVTVLNLPTAYWHEIVEHLHNSPLPPSVRLVVIGGEKASDEAWRRWEKLSGGRATLINTYGPTEGTVSATLHVAQPGETTLPIGRPLANVQIYILDEQLKPVAPGQTGELHIAGAGLARGYLGQIELTAKKFITTDLPGAKRVRLYKTGDLARFRPDGEIEFAGRTDEQVKIRGYRIELAEIEATLRTHPSLKEAIVVAHDDGHGKRLAAYFVARDGTSPGISELRNLLKAKLPAYMVPAFFIPLDKVPLTPSGKVDRRALPPPGEGRPLLDHEYVAPRTPVEEVITGIWRDVLGLEHVGIHDHFLDLGGHSLLATQVIARVREALQVELPLATLFSFPTVASLAERLAEASPQNQPVLPVSAFSTGPRLPLTPAQLRVWFLDQFEPVQSAYNMANAFRVSGPLHVPALEKSLAELAVRHEALRTVFPAEDGQPVQIICEPRAITLSVVDLSTLPEPEKENRAMTILTRESQVSYAMSNPILRPLLLRLSESEHLFLLVTHQIACDAESVRIVVNELMALYEAHATGQSISLPPLPLSYEQAASGMPLTPDEEYRQLQYWKRALAGAPDLLDLPADHPRPAHQGDAGARRSIHIDAGVVAALEQLGSAHGCDLFTTLFAAFQTLLHRYTGATDIVVGSTLSTRRDSDWQGIVGKFDNPVALRLNLSNDPAFIELLRRTRNVTEEARAHSTLPFVRIIDELRPPRHASYTPIFQVAFDLEPAAPEPRDSASALFTPFEMDPGTSKLDLNLHLSRGANGLSGWFEFSTALFNPDRITRMAAHLESLLASIAADPDRPISELEILPEDERKRLLVEWTATDRPFEETTLVRLFEEQVRQTPDAFAVVAENDRLTYRELNARANQLAHHLRNLGVTPGTLVGVCLERSWRLPVGLLGILKAGGAYVPLDPTYPRERLEFILDDAKASVLVTQQSLRNLASCESHSAICMDSDWPAIRTCSRENPKHFSSETSLAYVIYTSGSTGKPKGVAIEHRAAATLVQWAREVFAPDELRGVLASTSICFDLSVFELFVPLSTGGTAIIAENALALPSLPAAKEVTLVNTVPSALRELLRAKGIPDNVRVINLAGEPLPTELVNQARAETRIEKVYDLYGPSETTTYSTFALRESDEPATIGRPLANEQVYVLDANRRPVPIGIPGEIYIGGAKLARGYLNRPELTAERFVPNPFKPGTRLYRTGDLARWRQDGNLEFLGRIDHQVKVRGFRIELGEVESVLKSCPDCRDVVVVARAGTGGDQRLVAYATANPGATLSADALSRLARERLPEYMVPSAFVILDSLPLTPNGKINRQALPAPEHDSRTASRPFIAPRTAVEEKLAAIWSDVLGIQRIGIKDNFFELGGHSLLAIQVLSRARECFKVELPLFSLFEAPTVELLAEGLSLGRWTRDQLPVLPMQRVSRDQPPPASPMQAGLWFLDQLEPGSSAYNVPTLVRIEGQLDIARLEAALSEITCRHEALRTTFHFADGRITQIIAAPALVSIAFTDLTQADAPEERARELARADACQPFDLARGPLARYRVIRIGETTHFFVAVLHHTICDGTSIAILFAELETLYNATARGSSNAGHSLPELPLQFADFAHWQHQWMQGPVLEQALRFWRNTLAGAPTSIALPADRPEPERPTRHSDSCFISLPQDLVKQMAAVAQRHGCTPYMLLMSALSLVLHRWTGQRDLVIGAVAAGRNRREIEDVIGCFINFLPIRIRFDESTTGRTLVEQVKTAVLEAQAHQECPFEKIVEALNPERKQIQNPLYNVTLLLQNFSRILFEPQGLQTRFLQLLPDASPVDLEFEAEDSEAGMLVKCEFRTDLFERNTVEQLLNAFKGAIEAVVRDPNFNAFEHTLPESLADQARRARRSESQPVLAVAATFTAEPIEESLAYWMNELELRAQVSFAPYDQVFQQLLDPQSLFALNGDGLNVLLIRIEDWLHSSDADELEKSGRAQRTDLDRTAREFLDAVKSFANRSTAPLLVVFCPGSSASGSDSDRALLSATERTLVNELDSIDGVHTVGSDELLTRYPVDEWFDASGDTLGHVPYTPVFFTALSTQVARKFHALRHPRPKVIVLDCDQTLWGGVCGEDGAKGICLDAPRRALQEFMREQQEAGVLLAVCSKNNEEDVRDVFAQRNDMPLRSEHFSGWRLNWMPKSENLKSLAAELNLGLDSFVFIDDNPVECAEVSANCPEVLTLQLPDDPAQIPAFLQHCWIFDRLKLTDEDRKRGAMYRQNVERENLRAKSMSMADFVASLDLEIALEPLEPTQLARAAQLTQRTNQFNLTTIRRTESDIRALLDHKQVWTVRVSDRFGDYGLVGLVVLETRDDALEVETFLLSCRVLGRGVEHEILARLGKRALDEKLRHVKVHFVPSAKNKPAADFLREIGDDFCQPLNGGFIYQFPAEYAAEVVFNPRQSETVPLPAAATTEPRASRGNISKFTRCHAIALEANDAAAIHRAIEKKAGVRSGKQSDYTAPRSQIESDLCSIWEQLLRVERVGIDDNFFDLGGHSLLAVRLFAAIEKQFGRKLPLVTIFQAPTVAQLARELGEHNNRASRTPLVPVRPEGDLSPLFLVHGAGGDVLWGYANLAKHLQPGRPIYGIKSRGQVGLEEFDRVEDMARYYVSEIRAFQPSGPYYLGGYCLGGNIAYEMARQLRADGEHVALVALIDASPSNAGYETIPWWRPDYPFRFGINLSYWLRDFAQLPGDERRRFFTRKMRSLVQKISRRIRKQARPDDVNLEEYIELSHFPDHELRFWEIHLRAMARHTDQPYDGSVTLIRTRGQPIWCSLARDFCWTRLARGGVDVRLIPGSHENIFIEPHVRFLAQQLDASLAECQSEAQSTLPEPAHA